MEKIKDILYDKNDILVALIIVAIAALVILFRVNAIMDYPHLLVAQAKEKAAQASAEAQENSGEVTGTSEYEMPNIADGAGEADDTDSEKGGQKAAKDTAEQYSVYINYGETLYTVGEKFAGIGLFDSAEDFVRMVEKKGVATKIQAGNFIIPANATEEEVIECLVR